MSTRTLLFSVVKATYLCQVGNLKEKDTEDKFDNNPNRMIRTDT